MRALRHRVVRWQTAPRAALRAAWGAAVTLLLACNSSTAVRGVAVDPPRAVAAFDFTSADGRTVPLAPPADGPLVVFFGYTHCPDVCPTTLADWKRAKAKLGTDGDRVRFMFVSVDPARDTPAVADRYAKQFDRAFIGVSADDAMLARVMAAYGATAAREGGPDSTNYTMAHSGQSFLVDAAGRLVAMYPLGMGWDVLAADLKSQLGS